jgi:hypothetical protein
MLSDPAKERMDMRSTFAVALLLIMVPASLSAQEWAGYVTYEMAYPTGETGDFVGDMSLRGVGIGYRRFLFSPNFAIGVSWQWNTFQENSRDPIERDGITISGDQVRRIYASPLLLNAAYYYSGPEYTWRVWPYVGLGVGPYYIDKDLQIGIADYEEKTWHFGVAPRLGMYFPVYKMIDGVVNFSYNYVFKAGDDTAHSFWGIGIGFAYRK